MTVSQTVFIAKYVYYQVSTGKITFVLIADVGEKVLKGRQEDGRGNDGNDCVR